MSFTYLIPFILFLLETCRWFYETVEYTDVDLLEGQDKALCKHVKNRLQQLSMQDKVQHMSANNTGMCMHAYSTILYASGACSCSARCTPYGRVCVCECVCCRLLYIYIAAQGSMKCNYIGFYIIDL